MIYNHKNFCFISSAQVYVNFCTKLYIMSDDLSYYLICTKRPRINEDENW